MPKLSRDSLNLIEQISESATGFLRGKLDGRNSDYLILARHTGRNAPAIPNLPPLVEKRMADNLNTPIDAHDSLETNYPAKRSYLIKSGFGTNETTSAITLWTASTTADGDGRRNGMNLHLKMPTHLVNALIERVKIEPEILTHLNEQLFRKGDSKLPAPILGTKPIHLIEKAQKTELRK